MPAELTPPLLHITGYLTGATLYAMLLVLLVRSRSDDRLAQATACLGLAWNVGELGAHGAQWANAPALAAWCAATAYACLGFLASVVMHSVSRVRADGGTTHGPLERVVAVMAYTTAAVAGAIQLHGAATGAPLPSSPALDVTTLGLVLTSVPLVIATRRQHHWRRALWMSALAFFGVSALHLGRFHGANESWIVELVGHHASIPLAFAMLYRDYRFALADHFLKRGLTLLAVVAVVFTVYAAVAPELGPVGSGAVAILLGAWVATALVLPGIARLIHRFVDRIVLGRVNYATIVDDITTATMQVDTIDEVLHRACRSLAPALNATSVVAVEAPGPGAVAHGYAVPIPTSEPPRFQLVIGPLQGGRRLLSDDTAMLERVALQLARRIDAIRITAERYERMLRERELAALTTEAELRALRAQINPHFLFNSLTTIGYLIQEAPGRAKDTLMQLTTLLRAVLRSDGEFSSLGRERELVEAYLRIEHARFEDRLTSVIDIPQHLHSVRLPALIVQPLVENAIKHGVAPSRRGGHVSVSASLRVATNPPTLRIVVTNTGAPLAPPRAPGGGVGLESVSRRLQHYYGDRATFTLRRGASGETIAEMEVPVDAASREVESRTGSEG